MNIAELVVSLRALHARAVRACEDLVEARSRPDARIAGDVEHARDAVFDVGLECSADWVGELADTVARLLPPDISAPQALLPLPGGDLSELAGAVRAAHLRLHDLGALLADARLAVSPYDRLISLLGRYSAAVSAARAAEAAFLAGVAARVAASEAA